MGVPTRIQLSRHKGWRMPENTVKVDRSSSYGNPFVIGEMPSPVFHAYHSTKVDTAEQAVSAYRRMLMNALKTSDVTVDALLRLRGKNLACWCKIGEPCHADVLIELANTPICEEVAPHPPQKTAVIGAQP